MMLRDAQLPETKAILILELKRRHAALTELSHHINRTKSTILSAFIFPLILEEIIFKCFSVDHSFALYFLDSSVQELKNVNTMLAEMKKIHDLGKDADLYRLMAKHLGAVGESLAQKIVPLIAGLFEQAQIQQLLQNTIEFKCRNMMAVEINRNRENIRQSVRSLDASELDMLLKAGDRAILGSCSEEIAPQTRRELMFDIVKRVGQQGNWSVARDSFSSSISIPKIIAVMLGKKFISDPLVQRFFNNDLEPLPRFPHYKTREELLIEIDALDKKLITLKSRAKSTDKIASYMSFSIIAIMMIEILTGLEVPQVLWLVSVCFALYGTVGLFNSTKNYFHDHKDYKNRLKANVTGFRSLLDNDYTESVTFVDLNSSSDSRICIRCKPYGDLSAAKVAGIIKSILSSEDREKIDSCDGIIWVPASYSLPRNNLFVLKNKIQAALKTKKEKHFVKVNSHLDSHLWHEEVETGKSSTKKNKPSKSIVSETVAPASNRPIHTPVIPAWKSAKTGQPSTAIINSVKRNQHTLFKLVIDDFPDQKCMDKFRAIISECPKVVKAVGCQGLVFSKKYGGTLKAKVLGEFGDIRVYASQKEVAESGDTLYVFDKVDRKAH